MTSLEALEPLAELTGVPAEYLKDMILSTPGLEEAIRTATIRAMFKKVHGLKTKPIEVEVELSTPDYRKSAHYYFSN